LYGVHEESGKGGGIGTELSGGSEIENGE
jgi:hypothetical protein